MRLLPITLAGLGALIASGATWAQDANDGEPFGTAVAAPAAQNDDGPGASSEVHDNAPGELDDAIQEALADQTEEEDAQLTIRGHGRIAAPGHN